MVRLYVNFAFLSLNEPPHPRRSGKGEHRQADSGCKQDLWGHSGAGHIAELLAQQAPRPASAGLQPAVGVHRPVRAETRCYFLRRAGI